MRIQWLGGLILALLAVGVSAERGFEPEVKRTYDEFTGVHALTILQNRMNTFNRDDPFTSNDPNPFTTYRVAFIREDDKPTILALVAQPDALLFLGLEAFDDTQKKVPILRTDRDRDAREGFVEEVIVLDLGEDWLAGKLTGDTRIKVFGKKGNAIFTLSEGFKAVAYAELKAKPPKGDDATGE